MLDNCVSTVNRCWSAHCQLWWDAMHTYLFSLFKYETQGWFSTMPLFGLPCLLCFFNQWSPSLMCWLWARRRAEPRRVSILSMPSPLLLSPLFPWTPPPKSSGTDGTTMLHLFVVIRSPLAFAKQEILFLDSFMSLTGKCKYKPHRMTWFVNLLATHTVHVWQIFQIWIKSLAYPVLILLHTHNWRRYCCSTAWTELYSWIFLPNWSMYRAPSGWMREQFWCEFTSHTHTCTVTSI